MAESRSIHRIWTVSNVLSLSRILFVIPVIHYLHLGKTDPSYSLTALVFIVLGSLTDLFDGWLARKLNQVTDFGKIVDPLADKVGMAIVILFLATTREDFPFWFFGILVVRDLLIFFAGLYVRTRYNHLFVSNLLGKTTVTIIAFMVAVYTVKELYLLDRLYETLLWLSTGLLVASFSSYLFKFYTFLHTFRSHNKS